MSPRDSPQHRGSPAPSRPARDSACAGQPTSLQRRLQEYISNSRKLRPFARRTAPAARSTAVAVGRKCRQPTRRAPAGHTVRSSRIDRLMAASTAAPAGARRGSPSPVTPLCSSTDGPGRSKLESSAHRNSDRLHRAGSARAHLDARPLLQAGSRDDLQLDERAS
jgi:hypothetical protein